MDKKLILGHVIDANGAMKIRDPSTGVWERFNVWALRKIIRLMSDIDCVKEKLKSMEMTTNEKEEKEETKSGQ